MCGSAKCCTPKKNVKVLIRESIQVTVHDVLNLKLLFCFYSLSFSLSFPPSFSLSPSLSFTLFSLPPLHTVWIQGEGTTEEEMLHWNVSERCQDLKEKEKKGKSAVTHSLPHPFSIRGLYLVQLVFNEPLYYSLSTVCISGIFVAAGWTFSPRQGSPTTS